MVEKKFPKTAKEFYDNLIKLNTLKAMKITMKAVEKLHSFLLNLSKENYIATYVSVEESNDENKDDRKGAHQVYGECPNCGNILSGTGGRHNIAPNRKNPSGRQSGRYCLNCGKIYLKEDWRRNIFTEDNTPLFSISVLKY